MAAPAPRGPDQPADTFFLGAPPSDEPAQLDIRDPRNRNLFLLRSSDMDISLNDRARSPTSPAPRSGTSWCG